MSALLAMGLIPAGTALAHDVELNNCHKDIIRDYLYGCSWCTRTVNEQDGYGNWHVHCAEWTYKPGILTILGDVIVLDDHMEL